MLGLTFCAAANLTYHVSVCRRYDLPLVKCRTVHAYLSLLATHPAEITQNVVRDYRSLLGAPIYLLGHPAILSLSSVSRSRRT